MSTLLLKLEAIESRIASYSCPRGVPSRVHALRLRRCFQNNSRRQSAAVGERFPPHGNRNQTELDHELSEEQRNTFGGFGSNAQNGEKGGSEHAQVPKTPPIRVRTAKFLAVTTRLPLERQFGRGFGPKVQGDMFRPPFNEDRGVEPTEDEAALYSALKTGNPHSVLRALSNHAKSVGFDETRSLLSSMSPATFSEVLRCLDPKHFIGRYQELHMEISPRLAKQMGLSESIDLQGGFYKFCFRFIQHVKDLLEARHYHHPPTLSDYKYLLKVARATGHLHMAEHIWNSMTARSQNDKVSNDLPAPDADCYNCYLSTLCSNDSKNPLLRYRLRVISDNLAPRHWINPPYSLRGHKVGGAEGIRAHAALVFRQMVEAGISGNEETFCLMIISMAREGELSAVTSILRRVWNIDVEQLLASNEAELPLPKHYPRHSPFHPTKALLYAIAHTYGINNQIPTALRLIDYISSQYSVPIPVEVWKVLLQWTFVLSVDPKTRRRNGEPLETGKHIGQLPGEAVSNLWNTMISEPYKVKPTLEMYNYLISNLSYRQRYGEMQIRMEEARALVKKDIRALSHAQAIFNATTRRPSPVHLAERRMRDLVFARLRVRRNREYVERWVRILIKKGNRSLKYAEGWSDQALPNIVRNWMFFLPKKVVYNTGTGEVDLKTGAKKQKALQYLKKTGRSRRLELRGLRIRFYFSKRKLDSHRLFREGRGRDGRLGM
jgi:hypothetical protein